MPELTCLRCRKPLEESAQSCANCGEQITQFQRTYATRLIDGKYQIIERLGLGGMGEIFKVRHIHLNEQRVIKIMRANIASDEQSLQRFLQEARMATMIKHRNLAMLYDFATLEDGSYYMVWEFIEGTNIQKWIATNGPLPPRLALEVSIQALRGLEELHQMGIIHRDISPENIMLSQDHLGKLLAKVIDFGIAKQLSDSPESGHGLTQTGMFLGKLKYASPEQAGILRDGETLDHRSDLYSFAVVLYEMLAGRAPFVATSPQSYILKHATEKPPPIVTLNPVAKVPEAFEAIVMRGLAKDRDTRFQTAGDLLSELETIRQTVEPDSRFGLGDRLMTLAGKTLTDTRPAKSVVPLPTARSVEIAKTDFDSATIGDTSAPRTTLADRETVLDTSAIAASPTVISRAEAEPTLLTRAGTPLPSRRWLIGGAVAAALVVIAVAATFGTGLFVARDLKPDEVAAATPATTSATVVGTVPAGTPEQSTAVVEMATLYLVALPYGNVEKITDLSTNQLVSLEGRETALPGTLTLSPGQYDIVVSDPAGNQTPLRVELAAGRTNTKTVNFDVNVDEAVKELLGK